MPKKKLTHQTLIRYVLQFKEIILTVASIVAIALNAWFVTRIAPYADKLAEHTNKIQAMEVRQENMEEHTIKKLDYVISRLDKIYDFHFNK